MENVKGLSAEEKTCTCLNCGKPFVYDRRRANRRFCNDTCRMTYYGAKPKSTDSVEKVCKYCHKTFLCSSSTPTKIFCSNECTTAYHKSRQQAAPKKEVYQETHTCQYCGSKIDNVLEKK